MEKRKTVNVQMEHGKVIDDQDKYFGVKVSYDKEVFDIGWIDKQWNEALFKEDCEKTFYVKLEILFIKEFATKEEYYAWKESDELLVQ